MFYSIISGCPSISSALISFIAIKTKGKRQPLEYPIFYTRKRNNSPQYTRRGPVACVVAIHSDFANTDDDDQTA